MKLVHVSDQALFKVLLHATKHPTSAVNGLLLGTVETSAPGASPPTSPRAAGSGVVRVTVTDAIPVCHSFITLTPVIEVALSQVRARDGMAAQAMLSHTCMHPSDPHPSTALPRPPPPPR